jgi:hypothetical protein
LAKFSFLAKFFESGSVPVVVASCFTSGEVRLSVQPGRKRRHAAVRTANRIIHAGVGFRRD